ncbi:MAG: hypothetical protein OXG15_03080 [Gammaproteobacteria bacterium]|nr:hypothetical protein [Gammaproteobacteria bacterium]
MTLTIVVIVFSGQLLLEWITDKKLVLVQTFLLFFIAILTGLIARSQALRLLIKPEALRKDVQRTATEEKVLHLLETPWFKLFAMSVCSAFAAIVVGVLSWSIDV